MNFLRYLLSKPYRSKRKSEYIKDLFSKYAYEETQQQEIYDAILGSGQDK